MSYIQDFINLFFPNTCNICGRQLFHHENLICTVCKSELPYTNFHKYNMNPVEMSFWGRIEINKATSFLLYTKGDMVKTILHSIKYKGNKPLAIEMGRIFGLHLKENNIFNSIDVIIPVPLHPKKLNKRGYNQSELIAEGISSILDISVVREGLYKNTNTSTQTRKNRYERWINSENMYTVCNASTFENKNILLVDDVLTTGATLEACCIAFKNLKVESLNIATLAYAPS